MIDKHHQEEDEHNQHVKREKADRKDGVKRRPKPRCSGYNSGSKPVEIDGFTKSEITQQKEACPDEGYGHHRAHQRAGKQGTTP